MRGPKAGRGRGGFRGGRGKGKGGKGGKFEEYPPDTVERMKSSNFCNFFTPNNSCR